ncbi:MAG: cation:proton antiporter [archaeon]
MIENQLTIIGILMIFSIIAGLLSAKFKQPLVLGLLIIGMFIGPSGFGLVGDANMINFMIELGAILFLFVIGMEFSIKRLSRIGLKAITVTLFKVGIMFFTIFVTTVLLGFNTTTAAFTGVIFSFSSTAIITSILRQKQLIKRSEVPLLVAILVLEDAFGIFALTFFNSLNKAGAAGLITAIQHLVISLTILVAVYLLVAKFAERVVTWVTKNAGEEFIMFISLVLCVAFAYFSYLLHLSPSAGAFLAGSVISTFAESKKFEHSIKPYSLMFTSFFFIAIGTLIDLTAISENLISILVLMTVSIVSLFIAVGVTTKVFANFSNEGAIFSTIAMLPPGAFSLLVARESMSLGSQTDLVTITSVVILLSSIFMSIGIGSHRKLSDLISVKNGFHKTTSSLSNYTKTLFEEIEIENHHTRKLKSLMGRYLKTSFISLLIVVIASEISSYFHTNVPKYFIFGVGLLGAVMFFIRAADLFKKVIEQLVHILTTLEGGTRIMKTRKILKAMIYGLMLSLIGLFSPLLIYALGLSAWFLIISVVVIIASLILISTAYNILVKVSYQHKYIIPSYKKVDFKKEFNRKISLIKQGHEKNIE